MTRSFNILAELVGLFDRSFTLIIIGQMHFKLPQISWYWRFLIAFTIASTLGAVIWVFSQFKEPPGYDNVIFTSLQILMTFICLEGVRRFQNKYYHISFFKKRSIHRFFVVITSVLIGTIIYGIMFYFFKWLDNYVNNSEPPLLQHMVASLLIGLVMSIIFGLISFAVNWKNEYYSAHIENERFKKEIIKSNLNILKHQLDPHFMFNNFNTLYYLIDENTELAKSFLKNVSNIYRYILQNSEKSLIPAVEEYEMSKQYLDIIQQRYGKHLQVYDDTEADGLMEKAIPPLVLQQLIENVIKHNQIDQEHPLQLDIHLNNDRITVKNNNNPKRSPNTHGSGLDNIKERYKLITEKRVEVVNNPDFFSVSLPLISN